MLSSAMNANQCPSAWGAASGLTTQSQPFLTESEALSAELSRAALPSNVAHTHHHSEASHEVAGLHLFPMPGSTVAYIGARP